MQEKDYLQVVTDFLKNFVKVRAKSVSFYVCTLGIILTLFASNTFAIALFALIMVGGDTPFNGAIKYLQDKLERLIS